MSPNCYRRAGSFPVSDSDADETHTGAGDRAGVSGPRAACQPRVVAIADGHERQPTSPTSTAVPPPYGYERIPLSRRPSRSGPRAGASAPAQRRRERGDVARVSVDAEAQRNADQCGSRGNLIDPKNTTTITRININSPNPISARIVCPSRSLRYYQGRRRRARM